MTIMNEAEQFISNEIKVPQPKHEVVMTPELAQALPSAVNDVKDTVATFMDKVAIAKSNGDYFVEVSKEVFDHYMRGQKTSYFIYQDIRVYKYGEREGIETNERKTV